MINRELNMGLYGAEHVITRELNMCLIGSLIAC